jgi:hypothetical protein
MGGALEGGTLERISTEMNNGEVLVKALDGTYSQ